MIRHKCRTLPGVIKHVVVLPDGHEGTDSGGGVAAD